MKRGFFVLFVALVFALCSRIYPQEAAKTSAQLISEIREQVADLTMLNEQLTLYNTQDKATIDDLQNRILSISENADKSLQDLSEANETIIRQDEKIRTQKKVLAFVSAVLGAFFLLHIVILILKLKLNITLPYWLNTLL